MFKKLGAVLICLPLIFGLTSCSQSSNNPDDSKSIKVGTSPGPYSQLFKDAVAPILQNQGYKIEYQDFSVLKQADVALNEGSIDLNVDQHTAYMQVFNKEENAKLAAITEIPTVPAGLYSSRHHSLDDVADGHTVAIPQDASNQSRAYNILAAAGWITLKPDANLALVTENDIADNPHNLDIKPMDSATIPRSLPDLDWAVIPGSISYSSKVDSQLELFQEKLRPELILVATTTEDKVNSQWAQAVREAYASQEFKDYMKKHNDNNYWYVP
ncbi:MAG: MetQ/NlpA family ABC transporter substrate-binding protein [Corynebacterium matruchotii]|uniref:MetQ/NlpA family ABC transporter substrate-binding protein n=1 Tax=Corynebacterium matruchotii TaxID=43768 RepID=UPI0036122AF7